MSSKQTEIQRGPSSTNIILVVLSNGGSVLVEKKVGATWVVADRFYVDGAYPMDIGASKTRFTPIGGAEYEVQ